MRTLSDSSLTESERRVLDRFVVLLRDAFGARLAGVWLYGSRARGEVPGTESDVDVLVVLSSPDADDDLRMFRLLADAAAGEDENPMRFSLQLYEPERILQRRQIRSFFMQEVDRDKIVLEGGP